MHYFLSDARILDYQVSGGLFTNLEFNLPNNQLHSWNFIEATFWHRAHAGFDLIIGFIDTFLSSFLYTSCVFNRSLANEV